MLISLVEELELVFASGSASQRNDILRRVTDLFLQGARSFSEEQVELFDDVLGCLIERIERRALVSLSRQLAPIANAPKRTVYSLADHEDIAVSGPVLEQSERLSDIELAHFARTKSQAHLAAIAGRRTVSEVVTDVLVTRGDSVVATKISVNAGARFSPDGYQKLVYRARDDAELADKIANRTDLPSEVFETLLQQATDIVRRRLLERADPKMRDRINDALSAVADTVAISHARNSGGEKTVSAHAFIKQDPGLARLRIVDAARSGKLAETIDALSSVAGVPEKAVWNLVKLGSEEGVMILCKAAGLGWPEVKPVLEVTNTGKRKRTIDYKKALDIYLRLSSQTAQRVVRFLKLRKSITRNQLLQACEDVPSSRSASARVS